jgi:lipopolysaccharide export LptBFGC system permease protein LptF|tara:strand:+ start:1890 stop:2183 length:294 start_codon:yes stop_codon:yes gene_type:complete
MIKMIIEKGTAKNKKWKAIFSDGDKKIKTTQFGDNRYEDYTQHKDKSRRDKYRSRHKKDLARGNYMSAGYLSYYLLWGASTNLNTNIKQYKKKFKLN